MAPPAGGAEGRNLASGARGGAHTGLAIVRSKAEGGPDEDGAAGASLTPWFHVKRRAVSPEPNPGST